MTSAALRIGPHLGSWTTYLTTELNSLANGSHKVGGAVDNSDGRYPLITHMIILASWTPTAGGTIDLYQVPGVEDSAVSPSVQFNEADNTNAAQETWLVWRFRLRAATGAQVLISPPLRCYRYGLWQIFNRSGANLAASGNSWRYRFEDEAMET